MLDVGAYQRALAQRQMPDQNWPPVPGHQFNQAPQEVVPGFMFSQNEPPQQMPLQQMGQQQEQMPPELMQFLIALLGQGNGPNAG